MESPSTRGSMRSEEALTLHNQKGNKEMTWD